MTANYHTHTWRCHHARGREKEYVEEAIKGGLRVLGFSDHTPQVYPGGYICTSKMEPRDLEGYVDCVLGLKKEYQNDIEIRLGLEAEYLPALWEPLLRLLEPYPIEYLLLGQHYLGNGMDVPYCGVPTSDPGDLSAYCAQTREALATGRFLYFAHPDLLPFRGDPSLYEKEMTGLCIFCREKRIPLEINLLGLREGRNYPGERFWKIAARVGNTVVYGSDAHAPAHVYSEKLIKKADRFLEKCGIPRERLMDILDF